MACIAKQTNSPESHVQPLMNLDPKSQIENSDGLDLSLPFSHTQNKRIISVSPSFTTMGQVFYPVSVLDTNEVVEVNLPLRQDRKLQRIQTLSSCCRQ